MPSRFLRDLPAGRVEAIVMARPTEYGGGYGDSEGRGPWGGRWSRDEPEQDAHRACRRRRRGAPRRPRARKRRRPARSASSTTHDDGGGGLQVGAKLRHPSFGVGEVRAWQGAGNDMKVTMQFPGRGREDDPRAVPGQALAGSTCDGQKLDRAKNLSLIRLNPSRLGRRPLAVSGDRRDDRGMRRLLASLLVLGVACTGDAGGGTPGSGGRGGGGGDGLTGGRGGTTAGTGGSASGVAGTSGGSLAGSGGSIGGAAGAGATAGSGGSANGGSGATRNGGARRRDRRRGCGRDGRTGRRERRRSKRRQRGPRWRGRRQLGAAARRRAVARRAAAARAAPAARGPRRRGRRRRGWTGGAAGTTGTAGTAGTTAGGTLFDLPHPWTTDVSGYPKAAMSDTIINGLIAAGGWGPGTSS